jgi:hypothetical protein
VTRHLAHRFDDARIANAAAGNLLANHRLAGRFVRGVVLRAHWVSAAEAR